MWGGGGSEGSAASNDAGVTPTPSTEQTEHSAPHSLVKPASAAVALEGVGVIGSRNGGFPDGDFPVFRRVSVLASLGTETAVSAPNVGAETDVSAPNDANTKVVKVAEIEDRMGLENGPESTQMIQKDLDHNTISCDGPSESKGGRESSEGGLGASSPAAICGLATGGEFTYCSEITDHHLLEISRNETSSEPHPAPRVTEFPLPEPPSPATAFKGPITPPLALSNPKAGTPQKMQPKSAQDPEPMMTKVSKPEITQVRG